jgi:hypothetical protein
MEVTMQYRIADFNTTIATIIGCYLAHWYRSILERAHRAAKRYLERVGIIRLETLAEHFARSTPKECLDAANVIGVKVTLI